MQFGRSSLSHSFRSLGYRLRGSWRSGGPVITTAIVIVCVAVWAAEMLTRWISPDAFSRMVGNGAFAPVEFVSKPWTALTSVFMHAPGPWHLLFNMLTLWFLGSLLERTLGHWTYLALYLISGLGGSMGMMLYSRLVPPSANSLLISSYGASGAIFGLFGALIPVYSEIYRGSPQRSATMRSLWILVALGIAQVFFIPNVAWQDHIGGFVTGLVQTALVSWRPRWRFRFRRLAGHVWTVLWSVVVCAVVLIVLWTCGFSLSNLFPGVSLG